MDSGGKKAGKGALIQEEKSATLGVSQDQILFQAVKSSGNNKPCVAYGVTTNLILDDQGGQQISVRTDGKSPTLRAEMHGNQPCVLTAVGEKSKAIGFMRGLGGVQTMNEKMPTLQAANGMSGNNKLCICSAGFKPNQGAKAKGVGYEKEKCPTLLAGQEPAVCISFEPGIASRDGGHVYENVSGTIRATPGDNQMTVMIKHNQSKREITKIL